MKLLELHARIMNNQETIRIQYDNHENHENHKILLQKQEKN